MRAATQANLTTRSRRRRVLGLAQPRRGSMLRRQPYAGRGDGSGVSCSTAGGRREEYRRYIEGVAEGDDYGACARRSPGATAAGCRNRRHCPTCCCWTATPASSPKRVLDELGLTLPAVMAVAKGADRRRGGSACSCWARGHLYCRRTRWPCAGQRVRDETHRFAIGGHRRRRSRTPNLGPRPSPGWGCAAATAVAALRWAAGRAASESDIARARASARSRVDFRAPASGVG